MYEFLKILQIGDTIMSRNIYMAFYTIPLSASILTPKLGDAVKAPQSKIIICPIEKKKKN